MFDLIPSAAPLLAAVAPEPISATASSVLDLVPLLLLLLCGCLQTALQSCHKLWIPQC